MANQANITRLTPAFAMLVAGALFLGGCQFSNNNLAEATENSAQDITTEPEPNEAVELAAEPEKKLHDDLWLKIADSRDVELKDHKEINHFLKLHSSRMLFTKAAPGAAEPWLYEIVAMLEARNMPLELALLPIVESGYNAASRGAGVAGLWQLSAQTGRNFNLKVNKSFDARLDPMASTKATLDYLQHLHDMFGNDWISAVAAYNIGEGAFGNYVERNRRKGKPTDFYSLKLSRSQVPTVYKWLALAEIVRDGSSLKQSFPAIANEEILTRALVPNNVSLRQIAKASGISDKSLKALNPAFKTGAVPAKGEYWINLPQSAAEPFLAARDNLTPDAKNQPSEPLVAAKSKVKAKQYVVKSGDTLGSIAKKTGIKLSSLLKTNGLSQSSVIRPGQVLKLPLA